MPLLQTQPGDAVSVRVQTDATIHRSGLQVRDKHLDTHAHTHTLTSSCDHCLCSSQQHWEEVGENPNDSVHLCVQVLHPDFQSDAAAQRLLLRVLSRAGGEDVLFWFLGSKLCR